MSTDIIDDLMHACVASCTCMTKTPDFHYHAASCRYRALNRAIEQIAEQRATILNLSKVVANDLGAMEELRLQIRDAQEDAANYRASAEAEIAELRGQLGAFTARADKAKQQAEYYASRRAALAADQMQPVTDEAREDHPAAINPPTQAEQQTCTCAVTCIRANGGDFRNLDGSPKICKGLPGDGREIRFPRPPDVVKCSECGTTNTAPIKLTMGKVWRCSCGNVFEPKAGSIS